MSFEIKNLDQDNKIKLHGLKEVTNPILFSSKGVPTPDGLLSDEIFGVTPKDRSETFAYIRLNAKFFHPSIFEGLTRYSNKFINAASCIKKYKVVNGELVEDENGNNGIDWLVKIFPTLVFDEKSESKNKNLLAKSFNKYKKFMDKLIISPAFYRDVDTSKGFISVGEINRLYTEVLRLAKSIKDSDAFSMNLRDHLMYKMQSTIVDIFNYVMDDDYKDSGDTILGKEGLIYRTMLRKTVAYSSRLVLSQADNNTEHWSELDVTVDQTLVPLDSAAAQLFPFVIFNIKNLIHNRYKDGDVIDALDSNNKKVTVTIEGLEEYYSDDNIRKFVNRFIHSIGNRFAPVYIPNSENKKVYLPFNLEYLDGTKDIRQLTWCDLVYIGTVEAAEGKHMISTRFPMDTVYNQIIHKIKVASTHETEQLRIRSKVYEKYPKIRKEDIGTNTENKFREVGNISNASIGMLGADFDGDTSGNRTPFSNEANYECSEFLKSKKRSININGTYVYNVDAESVLMGYTLTKCTDESKVSGPVF